MFTGKRLRESRIWGRANDCRDLQGRGGPWEAAREGEVGRGVMLPGHQAGPGSAEPEKGSGRRADTGKVREEGGGGAGAMHAVDFFHINVVFLFLFFQRPAVFF